MQVHCQIAAFIRVASHAICGGQERLYRRRRTETCGIILPSPQRSTTFSVAQACALFVQDFRHAGGDALVWTTSIAAQLHGLEKACFWLAKSNDYPRATTARMMRELLVHCPNLKSLALTYHPEDVATPSPMMWTLQEPPQSVAQVFTCTPKL